MKGDRMMLHRRIVPAAVISALLAACSPPETGPQPVTGIETRLDDAMRRASLASARVAGIEIVAAGMDEAGGSEPDSSRLPAELRQRISIDWTGPAGPLVRAIADQIGYGFVSTGPEPAAPVILTMHRRDEQAWSVLRDAGIALKSNAEIVINVPSRIVEMRWPELNG